MSRPKLGLPNVTEKMVMENVERNVAAPVARSDNSAMRLEALKLAVERFKHVPAQNQTTNLILDEAANYVKFITGSHSDNSN